MPIEAAPTCHLLSGSLFFAITEIGFQRSTNDRGVRDRNERALSPVPRSQGSLASPSCGEAMSVRQRGFQERSLPHFAHSRPTRGSWL
jgi:hypothetical protein